MHRVELFENALINAQPKPFFGCASDRQSVELRCLHVDLEVPHISSGYYALHIATRFNDVEAVKILLDRGADVNQVGTHDNMGATALHIATEWGDVEMIELLVTRGARVNCRDKRGQTVLHQIRDKMYDGLKKARVINILLDAGADVNITCEKGQTALRCQLMYNEVLRGALVKHIAKLFFSKRHVCPINLKLIEGDKLLKRNFDCCIKELSAITKTTISGMNRSLTEFLEKDNTHVLYRYVKNPAAVESFANKHCRSQFPIYREILIENLNLASKRRELLNNALEGLGLAIPCIDRNGLIAHKIINLLNDEALENLAIAGELAF